MANAATLRPFVPAIYGVGVIMALVAIGDYAGNVWPWRVSDYDWRYGALGIFSSFLVTPIFGLLLISAGAALARHRLLLRIMGIVAIGASAALLVGIALFSLDAVQVRQQAAPEARWLTTVSSLIAAFKYFLGAVVLFVTGMGGLRGAKVMDGGSAPARSARTSGGLVVGAS